MAGFSIKELEILSGIKAHTIRIWEQRYKFLKPLRSDSNIRIYSLTELKNLLQISLLNTYGFKISLIDQMQQQEIDNAVSGLKEKNAKEGAIINELFIRLFSLDINAFEEILDLYIQQESIAAAILNIIDPFLIKIELLRIQGSLKKECEHLIVNVVRKSLIAGIQQLEFANAGTKTVISFLPENYHYEIELLYMQYLLKQKGLNVIYLGANVPVKDVAFISKFKKPDFVHTHLSTATQYVNPFKFLEKLSTQFPDITVVITGNQLENYKKDVPANIKLQPAVQKAAQLIA